MNMKITDAAAKKLDERVADKKGYVKLKYDIDGCGCGVNGVAALWLESFHSEDERRMETGSFPIYIEKSKEVFFDEKMTLDYSESAGCFQLKSPNEYLNPRMSFYDKTEV